MQRTFYPKHVSYYGNGSGRDAQITQNNGGLSKPLKVGMGHLGVHFSKYNSNVSRRVSPSPRKEATTFYYQSDGSGRDSYVLKNNGGLRWEYSVRTSGDNIFKDSLRSDQKSPVKYFQDPLTHKADITTYLNWKSLKGVQQNAKHARIQKELTERLTSGSPSREHTINYVVGTGQVGRVVKESVPSYQGYAQTYKKLLKHQAAVDLVGDLQTQKRFGSTINKFGNYFEHQGANSRNDSALAARGEPHTQDAEAEVIRKK